MAAAWTRTVTAVLLWGAVLLSDIAIAHAATLAVQDAWIRAVPGANVAAAYLTLRNTGAQPVTVTGVRTSAAAQAMIHETVVENGLARMRPHEHVIVPAGSTVKLQPGGLHVMLQGLARPLVVGQTVPLELLLSNGDSLQVTATVRPLNGA